MPMLKPMAVAAVSVLALAVASPALAAKPARAFECPATEAEATALLSELTEVGAEVVDEYGFHTRTFEPEGYTVIGLPVFRLEVISNTDARFSFVAFQAKTDKSFRAARKAMFEATGRAACENTYEDMTKLCKVIEPPLDGVSISRYIEVSNEVGINVGCQYARPKG